MFNCNNIVMKKKLAFILVLFIFCLGLLCNNANPKVYAISDKPESVRVITSTTCIYKTPSITGTILKDDVLKDTIFKVDNLGIDYDDFYRVYIYNIVENAEETDLGYILKAHALDATISSPIKKLDSNAVIQSLKAKTYSYNSNDKTYSETSHVLDKNTPIRILDGYDKNKEYTYISFTDENDVIISYYVKTSDIYVQGVNYSVIIAISTLISCVALILIITGIKGKKKK